MSVTVRRTKLIKIVEEMTSNDEKITKDCGDDLSKIGKLTEAKVLAFEKINLLNSILVFECPSYHLPLDVFEYFVSDKDNLTLNLDSLQNTKYQIASDCIWLNDMIDKAEKYRLEVETYFATVKASSHATIMAVLRKHSNFRYHNYTTVDFMNSLSEELGVKSPGIGCSSFTHAFKLLLPKVFDEAVKTIKFDRTVDKNITFYYIESLLRQKEKDLAKLKTLKETAAFGELFLSEVDMEEIAKAIELF